MTDIIIDPNPEAQGFEPWNVQKAELNTQPGVWQGDPSPEAVLDDQGVAVDPNVAITEANQTPMVMPEGDVEQTPMPEYWREPPHEREAKGDERPEDDNEKKNSMNQSPGVWEGAPSADILVTEAPPPEPPPEGGLRHPVAALGAILGAGQGPLEPPPEPLVTDTHREKHEPDHSHRHRRR